MNLTLKQALKYGAAEDMVRASYNTMGPKGRLFTDPVHTLVTADAIQEEGHYGMAHLLRAQAKYAQAGEVELNYPVRSSQVKAGVGFGKGLFEGGVDIIGPGLPNWQHYNLDPKRAKQDGHKVAVTIWTSLDGDTNQHTRMFLEPEEAKEATAHLPEADRIHKFIDSHFNAQPEAR